mgnify:CR=1 FL=1
MSKIIRKELSLINKKIDALRDEYRKKIKAFASDSNTTSADLEEIYVEHLISYTDEDKYGELIDVWYVDHNLEEELSTNINTPEYILDEIHDCEVYACEITDNVRENIACQNLLIAKNINSTTHELNNVYLWFDEIFIAMAKHPNTSSKKLEEVIEYEDIHLYIDIVNHPHVNAKTLDKMSCVFDEVDSLILEHPMAYAKTKKKINKKR